MKTSGLLFALGLAVSVVPVHGQTEKALAPSKKVENDFPQVGPNVLGFVEKHCIRCHGPAKENGEVRLDAIPSHIINSTIAQQWQDVLDILNIERMPPPKEPRPTQVELSDTIETLTRKLQEAQSRFSETGGGVVMRRLNRREYQLTIRDLLGVHVNAEALPEDSLFNGFDTVGLEHHFSSFLLDRYLLLGGKVIESALATKVRPETQTIRIEIEGTVNKDLRDRGIKNLEKKVQVRVKQGGAFLAKAEGDLEMANSYLKRPETETGSLIPYQPKQAFDAVVPRVAVTFGKNNNTPPAAGNYLLRIRLGAASETPVDDLYLALEQRIQAGTFIKPITVRYFQVRGTVAEPATLEIPLVLDGRENHYFSITQRGMLFTRKGRGIPTGVDDAAQTDIWIDWIEKEGPINEAWPSLGYQRIFFKGKDHDQSEDDVKAIIRNFAFEAFRHAEPDPVYLEKLHAIYSTARTRGAPHADALKETLAVVLASPRFLYLTEPKPDTKGPAQLTDRELAVRLSYFLWSSPPDAELYKLAEAGELRKPEVLKRQVDRLLDSPKSAAFSENFINQWLQLNRLDQVAHDKPFSSIFDLAVRQSAKQEPIRFFETLVREDLSLANFIDSDFVVIDSVLGNYYGLKGAEGDEFRKIRAPADSGRGGLLGQAAILTMTSEGDRTSPVERGVFVLRKLLNSPPPPAPANVPQLVRTDDDKDKSIREIMSAHTNKAACASCHRRIDPLGYGLENFNPIGLWRTHDDTAETRMVDSTGTMPDGKRTFKSYVELKTRMMEEKAAFAKGFTVALLTYSVGRPIGFADQTLLRNLVDESLKNDYRTRTLVYAIVQSDAFLTK